LAPKRSAIDNVVRGAAAALFLNAAAAVAWLYASMPDWPVTPGFAVGCPDGGTAGTTAVYLSGQELDKALGEPPRFGPPSYGGEAVADRESDGTVPVWVHPLLPIGFADTRPFGWALVPLLVGLALLLIWLSSLARGRCARCVLSACGAAVFPAICAAWSGGLHLTAGPWLLWTLGGPLAVAVIVGLAYASRCAGRDLMSVSPRPSGPPGYETLGLAGPPPRRDRTPIAITWTGCTTALSVGGYLCALMWHPGLFMLADPPVRVILTECALALGAIAGTPLAGLVWLVWACRAPRRLLKAAGPPLDEIARAALALGGRVELTDAGKRRDWSVRVVLNDGSYPAFTVLRPRAMSLGLRLELSEDAWAPQPIRLVAVDWPFRTRKPWFNDGAWGGVFARWFRPDTRDRGYALRACPPAVQEEALRLRSFLRRQGIGFVALTVGERWVDLEVVASRRASRADVLVMLVRFLQCVHQRAVLSEAYQAPMEPEAPDPAAETRDGYLTVRPGFTACLALSATLWVTSLVFPSPSIALAGSAAMDRPRLAAVQLALGADPNAEPFPGFTPLSLAAANGATNLIPLLIRHGADVNPDGRWPPLIAAARNGQIQAVRLLLSAGADPNAVDEDGDASLHVVCSDPLGSLGVLHTLLDAGADLEERDAHGDTPLLTAVRSGNTAAAYALANSRASVTARNEWGRTALHRAILWGNEALAKSLVSRLPESAASGWCPLGSTPDSAGWAQLHWACALGTPADVRRAIGTYGVAPAASASDITPLHVAAARGDAESVDELMRAGIPPDARGTRGRTPLHVAAVAGNANVVRQLLEAGVEGDTKTEHGWTPLCYAAASGDMATIEALADAGASLDPGGQTPAAVAARYGHVAAVRRLWVGEPEPT